MSEGRAAIGTDLVSTAFYFTNQSYIVKKEFTVTFLKLLIQLYSLWFTSLIMILILIHSANFWYYQFLRLGYRFLQTPAYNANVNGHLLELYVTWISKTGHTPFIEAKEKCMPGCWLTKWEYLSSSVPLSVVFSPLMSRDFQLSCDAWISQDWWNFSSSPGPIKILHKLYVLLLLNENTQLVTENIVR